MIWGYPVSEDIPVLGNLHMCDDTPYFHEDFVRGGGTTNEMRNQHEQPGITSRNQTWQWKLLCT